MDFISSGNLIGTRLPSLIALRNPWYDPWTLTDPS
jgi:hypothetical protein